MKRSPITTHVLDVARGKPAAGVPVRLSFAGVELARGTTDTDGRAGALLPVDHALKPGVYELRFETGAYFQGAGFYPSVTVAFEIKATGEHYHVPLLLSPYGYSTYRGS